MKNVRWGWILLGGFLAELAVFALVIPPTFWAGQESLLYTAPPASFVATCALGFWIAKSKTSEKRVLHGTLVGVVAMLIYVAMTLGQTIPLAYLLAHALKVLGGASGGFLAAKRTARAG
jgi:putative membrane protein (TIGR04086 family)